MRKYRSFSYRDTNLKVLCSNFNLVVDEIVKQRKLLERYIASHPEFRVALEPIELVGNAPCIAQRMSEASRLAGIGPMAAVAGTLAQAGVEKAIEENIEEAIVENGGDIYIVSDQEVLTGIYGGRGEGGAHLAFRLKPDELPVAICSSSSYMGHSRSFGECELATVVSENAALADCAATLLCNSIRSARDLESSLEKVGSIEGVRGAMAVRDGKYGFFGNLPELTGHNDKALETKITRDSLSSSLSRKD